MKKQSKPYNKPWFIIQAQYADVIMASDEAISIGSNWNDSDNPWDSLEQ